MKASDPIMKGGLKIKGSETEEPLYCTAVPGSYLCLCRPEIGEQRRDLGVVFLRGWVFQDGQHLHLQVLADTAHLGLG